MYYICIYIYIYPLMKPCSKDVDTDLPCFFQQHLPCLQLDSRSLHRSAGSWMTSLALLWEMVALQVGHAIRGEKGDFPPEDWFFLTPRSGLK